MRTNLVWVAGWLWLQGCGAASPTGVPDAAPRTRASQPVASPLPRGFREVDPARDRDLLGLFEDGNPLPGLGARYYATDDASWIALLEHYQHPHGKTRYPSLLHEVAALYSGDLELDASSSREAIAARFNWYSSSDAGGYPSVEWGYVQKGCEREEVYERFVDLGESIWHARLRIDGASNDELAGWLTRFFDAPLQLPPSPERRSLRDEKTPR